MVTGYVCIGRGCLRDSEVWLVGHQEGTCCDAVMRAAAEWVVVWDWCCCCHCACVMCGWGWLVACYLAVWQSAACIPGWDMAGGAGGWLQSPTARSLAVLTVDNAMLLLVSWRIFLVWQF